MGKGKESSNVPQMKREVGIFSVLSIFNEITFAATPDALEEIKKAGFGQISVDEKNRQTLKVDPRFDFEEVAAYLKNYGQKSDK